MASTAFFNLQRHASCSESPRFQKADSGNFAGLPQSLVAGFWFKSTDRHLALIDSMIPIFQDAAWETCLRVFACDSARGPCGRAAKPISTKRQDVVCCGPRRFVLDVLIDALVGGTMRTRLSGVGVQRPATKVRDPLSGNSPQPMKPH